MSRTPRFPRLPLVLAALMAMPALMYEARTAEADVRVRVRGKVDVHVRARPRVHRHRGRMLVRYPRAPRPARVGGYYVDGGIYWSGGIYVGPTFSAPPPPPPPPPPPAPDCDCEPSYYAPPAYAAPAPASVTVAAPSKPALPRWGIGVFAGAIDVDERMQGQELGVLGRLRLSDALLLEAELARTDMLQGRMDQRAGGALLLDLSPRSRLSVHLLGGLGVTQTVIEDWHAQQGYAELGAGVTWRVNPRLHLTADVRAGAREQIEVAPASASAKALAPSATAHEEFTRGRLSAIVSF